MALQPVTSFFTSYDNDFILKGARDPLGFQTIWQQTARQLIPSLNTVCGNLRDWQILCLGQVLHRMIGTGEHIVPFFIRFEQLMAHTRIEMKDEVGFNGIDKTKRIRAEGGEFRNLGNRSRNSQFNDAELLTNQRSYGIWGKYNSPFEVTGLGRTAVFDGLFAEKLERVRKDSTANRLLQAVENQSGAEVRAEDLASLQVLLKITEPEAGFFRQYLLQHREPAHFQNRLYAFCESGTIPADLITPLDLFAFLDSFAENADADLITALRNIQQTELVLCPLNRFFRALQTQPIWAISAVEANEYLQSCCQPAQSDGLQGDLRSKKRELASWLHLPIHQLLEAMLKENEVVAARRGGSPWMSLSNSLLQIHHTEGAFRTAQPYQPGRDYDNTYFLSTYLNLFEQAKPHEN